MSDQLDDLLVCRLDFARQAPEPCTVVIFGASGDLAARKLIPALHHLAAEKRLPPASQIIGFARREKTDDSFRAELKSSLDQFARTKPVDAAAWAAFASNLRYCRGEFGDPAAYAKLKAMIQAAPGEAARRNALFYLAVAPGQFTEVVGQLFQAGLLAHETGWRRLVVEKPFGFDLASAQKLNAEISCYANEKQVFRIDHYLGKETVQNILVFRFSNAIFEPLWNRQSVDHVQVTFGEKIGVGNRGGFYEEAGALRDVVQNHLLQVLALAAMEPPVSLEPEAIRDEKVKFLKSIRPLLPAQVPGNVVRGQYAEGTVDGQFRVAYRQEARVKPASSVETFAAWRLFVDNWRWSGVPFYLRAGKSLPMNACEVRVQFRATPNVLFALQCGPKLDTNSITLRLQPDEGIALRFNGKVPGASTTLRPVRMNFTYNAEFGAYTPEAYERLLLEAIAGDSTLFIRRDEAETAWTLIDPIRESWGNRPLSEQEFYPAGTWGPVAADQLLGARGHEWRNPQPPQP